MATPWSYLTSFFIEYPPSSGAEAVPRVKVFANGRQQVRIRVVLSPRNVDGEFVPVPVDELKSIVNLVDYDTGHLLPDGWTVHWQANEYTYADWAISNAPGKSSNDYASHDNRPNENRLRGRSQSGDLAVDQIAVEYFVTTEHAQSLRIAASVAPPGAAQPIDTRPGSSGNTFDSSVNIDGRPPLNLPAESFVSREVGIISNSQRAVTNVYFTLFYQSRKISLLYVQPQNSENRLNIYVHRGDSHGWEGAFTICQTSYQTNGTWTLGLAPSEFDGYVSAQLYMAKPPIQNPEFGAILYVQHLYANNMHPNYPGEGSAGEVYKQGVYFVDEYGNRHRVVVGSPVHDDFPWFRVCENW
jgi:hypothetical protein